MFPDINKKQTKENVHQLLEEYRSMARVARDGFLPKLTATYSFEPKQPGGKSDPTARNVSMQQKAESRIRQITKAMNKLNPFFRKVLYYKYMEIHEMSDKDISSRLNMSERTYYRALEKAQLQFAEAYDGGSFLAENWQENGRKSAD